MKERPENTCSKCGIRTSHYATIVTLTRSDEATTQQTFNLCNDCCCALVQEAWEDGYIPTELLVDYIADELL